MKYDVLHDIPGRLRVHCHGIRVNQAIANAIGELLSSQDGILSAELSIRTGNLLLYYSRIMPKRHVLALLDVLEPSDWEGFGLDAGDPPPSFFEMSLCAVFSTAFWHVMKWVFLPPYIRYGITALSALPVVFKGMGSLGRGNLDIAVLDATALSILAARRDFGAIRTILWMFAAADSLEEWTREQSRNSLADSLALKIDSVWVKTPAGDVRRPMSEVRPGDLIVVQTGSTVSANLALWRVLPYPLFPVLGKVCSSLRLAAVGWRCRRTCRSMSGSRKPCRTEFSRPEVYGLESGSLWFSNAACLMCRQRQWNAVLAFPPAISLPRISS